MLQLTASLFFLPAGEVFFYLLIYEGLIPEVTDRGTGFDRVRPGVTGFDRCEESDPRGQPVRGNFF